MSKVEMNAYEFVLRACADAAPNAWHPHHFSRRSGMPLEQVNAVLKELWDIGLLEKAPAHPDFGPGLRLSAKGWQVLNDRAELRRLCSGELFIPDEKDGFTRTPDRGDNRGTVIIKSLQLSQVAYVSWLLLGANILVFLIGLWLAYRAGIVMPYVGGEKTLIAVAVFLVLFVAFNVRAISRYLNSTLRLFILLGVMALAYKTNLFFFPAGGPADAIRRQCGLLSAQDWLRGEWWRALTACFVHLGLLHLLGNMSMLYNGGWFIERMWGHARFFTIYILAGFTGSLVGLAFNPGGLAGASGALCGLVAAEAVWVIFNGKYLPDRLRQEWWNNLSLNLILLVAISSVPGISFWGHLGGGLAGAAAAVCLHYQRFGAPVWRWAALLGLLPIPFIGLYLIDRERHTQQIWEQAELNNFNEGYKANVEHPLTKEMRTAFIDQVRPVLKKPADDRDAAKVEAALAVLAEQRKQLEGWQAQLKALGPYVSKDTVEKREAALKAVEARLDIYERAERSLREGAKFSAKELQELMTLIAATPELQTKEDRHLADVKNHQETEEEKQTKKRKQERVTFENETLPKISSPLKAAQTLFDDKLAYDVYRNPAEWVPATMKKNRAALDQSRKQVKEVIDLLAKQEKYQSEAINEALAAARPYAEELAKLLDMTERRFDLADKWTDDEQKAMKEQEKKVDALRKTWRKLLE